LTKVLQHRKLVLLVLGLYCVLQIFCINQLSINYDEPLFAAYGASILKFERQKDIVLYESKLPITALNMIPRAVEQITHPHLKKTWNESLIDIVRGRYISLFVSVLLGLLIFRWARQLYDDKTAFFCLLLFLLCPNFLAHSIFVSPDIFACFFVTLTFYYLWLFSVRKKTSYWILMSLASGLAQISKFSMVHIFILIPLVLLIKCLVEGKPRSFYNVKKIAAYSLSFFFINWLIICASHLFYQLFVPMHDYHFMSSPFRTLAGMFPRIPVPFPSSYIGSMDAVMYFDHLGGGVKGSIGSAPYLLGRNSTHGFWYYYFVVMFFKVPVTVLLLWLCSFAILFWRTGRISFTQKTIFLTLPIAYYLIYMNFFYSTQIGIRHIMIVFPFLYILTGNVILLLMKNRMKYLLLLFLTYEAISVLLYFPHFLPYTNEFILDKKMAYRKVADTNLCYGEGKKFLEEYRVKHPGAVYMPDKPTFDTAILEVNEMLNLDMATVHKYDWAQHFIPIDHISSQYLIFTVKREELDSVKNQRAQ
jgi:hypothetical protein